MAAKPRLNVQSFPRPPLLERTSRHLQIKWHDQIVADTREAYWVLETHHPPTYYLPPSSLKLAVRPTRKATWCEWKGRATYYSVSSPGTPAEAVDNRIWSYDNPSKGFEPIKGYLSFYAGPWDCFVDGEKVEPQPGDFYGGWVTSDIDGVVKGRTGNMDPVL